MNDKNGFLLVFCTCPNSDVAQQIASTVVEAQLAACVNIVPSLTSVYLWQGKVETSNEVLLKIKTRSDLYQALQDQITQLHPYDVPEIIATEITHGLPDYLNWLADSCMSNPQAK